MKIYIIRHGRTPLNQRRLLNAQLDEFLTSEGIEQAKAAADIIHNSVKHIYSSSLTRTRQTAEIINQKLKLPITLHDELREIHMGAYAGRSWEDLESGQEKKKQHRSINFDYRDQGGESANDFKNRVISFLKQINGNHANGEALIVTHGGIIRLLHLLEHNTELLDEIENASIHEVNVEKILKNN